MKRNRFVTCAAVLAAGLAAGQAWPRSPVGTAFTYQGQLKQAGVPIDGTADFAFTLWDAETGGAAVGAMDPHPGVNVVSGLFTVQLDFGGSAFAGDARWLETTVTYPAGADPVTLVPRQPITPAPYAIRALDGGGLLWQANGGDVYYNGGRVGIGTDTPKQALHNTGDYYGKGHLWLYAYQGDGQNGTAYVQARDDSGTSSIGMKLRTQSDGTFVDAVSVAPTGGVGIGVPAPPEGLWVRGHGVPGFGGQMVIDSSDTSGAIDSGSSILFTNLTELPGAHLGALSCFKEDGDPAHGAYYLSLATKANNNPSEERMRITSTGRVGIGTSNPRASLHVGDVGNWNWTSGDGWGDFTVGNGIVGLAVGVADGGGGTGDVRLWARGGTERLYIGSPTDGVTVTIDDAKVGIGTTTPSRRLDVESNGETSGISDWSAHFKDTDGTGEAWIAGDDGFGHDYGIETRGGKAGGFFHDTDVLADARVAYTNANGGKYGIWALGANAGGYFENKTWDSNAYLGFGETGIDAEGAFRGGDFHDSNSGTSASVAEDIFSIIGTGAKAFVQNDPYDKSRVIIYAAPEGDEVATYTRGTARLVSGEARVSLGKTFQWVTNPDIGLTAHLTPRGDCKGLYVASVTTTELVVRELGAGTSNAVFDYLVYGLRIGFEEVAVVQEKQREAYIPSMSSHRERYEKHSDLRQYNAMERFKRMDRAIGNTEPVDFGAARNLRDAVVEFDPAVHAVSAASTRRASEDLRTIGSGPRGRELEEGKDTTEASGGNADIQVPVSGGAKERLVEDTESPMTAQQWEIVRLRNRLERIEAALAELANEAEGGDR